jgi:hypothetical protein
MIALNSEDRRDADLRTSIGVSLSVPGPLLLSDGVSEVRVDIGVGGQKNIEAGLGAV